MIPCENPVSGVIKYLYQRLQGTLIAGEKHCLLWFFFKGLGHVIFKTFQVRIHLNTTLNLGNFSR